MQSYRTFTSVQNCVSKKSIMDPKISTWIHSKEWWIRNTWRTLGTNACRTSVVNPHSRFADQTLAFSIDLILIRKAYNTISPGEKRGHGGRHRSRAGTPPWEWCLPHAGAPGSPPCRSGCWTPLAAWSVWWDVAGCSKDLYPDPRRWPRWNPPEKNCKQNFLILSSERNMGWRRKMI